MNNIFLLVISLTLSTQALSFPKIPDIKIAPGHLCSVKDSDFERFRYKEQIPYCTRNVSIARKDKICSYYGVSVEERRKNYTVDHIIPLSLGGSNSDKNLWCQHRAIYTGHLEYWLYKKIESGKINQKDSISYILDHKFNPEGKDHIPLPPDKSINTDQQQEDWEADQDSSPSKF
jgi:hypothetical protein